jgi:hypothetical protein
MNPLVCSHDLIPRLQFKSETADRHRGSMDDIIQGWDLSMLRTVVNADDFGVLEAKRALAGKWSSVAFVPLAALLAVLPPCLELSTGLRPMESTVSTMEEFSTRLNLMWQDATVCPAAHRLSAVSAWLGRVGQPNRRAGADLVCLAAAISAGGPAADQVANVLAGLLCEPASAAADLMAPDRAQHTVNRLQQLPHLLQRNRLSDGRVKGLKLPDLSALATHGKHGYIDFSGCWAKEQGPNLYRAARANWLLNNLAAASVALLQSRAQLEM